MAAWQFKFSIVPVAGIFNVHGAMVAMIPELAAHVPDALIDEDEDFPNYWDGIGKEWVHTLAQRLLPQAASWSSDAIMYGHSRTDDIQIWEDSVDVRLDCANLDIDLLKEVVNAASDANCCLVLAEGGKVIAPTLDQVIDALSKSSASRFVKDPKGFLLSQDRIFNPHLPG